MNEELEIEQLRQELISKDQEILKLKEENEKLLTCLAEAANFMEDEEEVLYEALDEIKSLKLDLKDAEKQNRLNEGKLSLLYNTIPGKLLVAVYKLLKKVMRLVNKVLRRVG